ncbi:MAG: 4-(cytidine 5'-diphospho)-2-C-methyl-D-erythritol kinase [Firmicutes bacterium]|nr:4-(cytidine 5'-diphospho)-2-C-methyl-D-erythritol kinase [Bacillota bacterium]
MIKEYANAKINLALDVVKKRKDGYHELQMIMIPIELSDMLEFESSLEISLLSNIEIENNSIISAAKLMKDHFKIESGAKITLTKNIPIGAGLGGGSADIAATLRGLNQLWSLNLVLEDLESLALELGSDTLFCLHNKPAYVYGRGENLLFIDLPEIEAIYLLTSNVSVLTTNIFQHHKIKYKSGQFDRLFRNYLNQKYDLFFKKTYNKLTKTVLKCYPELKKIYQEAIKIDSRALMSGSGSTFYILSFKQNDMSLEDKLNKYGIQYVKTKPKA